MTVELTFVTDYRIMLIKVRYLEALFHLLQSWGDNGPFRPLGHVPI